MNSLRGIAGAAFAATILVLTGVVSAGPAQAAVIACGTTITQSTTLTANVGPCAGDGIIITADNITLNLNNKKITGKNRLAETAGVRLVNVSGVTVRGGGTVERFDAGVAVFNGSGNTVRSLVVRDNVNDFPDADCDLGDGIAVQNSSGNTILGNNVIHNGPYGGISLIENSDGNLVKNNTLVDNNLHGQNCGNGSEDEGIRLEGPGANGNHVEGNTVTNSLLSGIGIHGYVGCDETPPRPPAEPPPPPHTLPNTDNVIMDNHVSGTAGAGESDGIKVLQQGPFGVVVCAAFRNTIVGNNSSSNEGNGITIPGTSIDNTVNNNEVNSNGGDGIRLDGPVVDNEFTNLGGEVLDMVSPDQPPFLAGTDFLVMSGSGSGDVTGRLRAIDIAIPAGAAGDPVNTNPPDTSTSGCELSDYTAAGFQPGDIALIQRGTCTFVSKVAIAVQAGASAVVMFNEGQTGRTSANFGGVGPQTIPVLSATYAVGHALYDATQSGPVTVHVVTNTTNVETKINVGAKNNTLTKNTGFNNVEHDGHDSNPGCDNNHWSGNKFGTVNRACVKANGGTGKITP